MSLPILPAIRANSLLAPAFPRPTPPCPPPASEPAMSGVDADADERRRTDSTHDRNSPVRSFRAFIAGCPRGLDGEVERQKQRWLRRASDHVCAWSSGEPRQIRFTIRAGPLNGPPHVKPIPCTSLSLVGQQITLLQSSRPVLHRREETIEGVWGERTNPQTRECVGFALSQD